MAQSKFFHFFPIPSFLLMPAAGLSLCDSSARFIEFAEKDGTASVEKFGSIELPKGAVVSGEIRDLAAVSKALSDLGRAHGLNFVRVTVADEKTYLFTLNLPALEDKDMRSALEFKIDENVPLSPAEVIFDYALLPQDAGENTGRAAVAAISKKAADSYLETFKKAGLQPLRLSLESQAIANAVIPQSEKGTFLIVNLAAEKTGLFLVDGNIVQFSLTIMNDQAGAAAEAGAASSAAPRRLNLDDIKREAGKIVDYWQSKNASSEGALSYKAILCGAAALDPDFFEKFKAAVGTEASIADPWCNVFVQGESVPPISKEESFGYAAAIGAALTRHTISPSHV